MVVTVELKPENYAAVSDILNTIADAMYTGVQATGFCSMSIAKVHPYVPLRCCAWGAVWYVAYDIKEIVDNFQILQSTVTEVIGGDADIYREILRKLLGDEKYEILRRVYVFIEDTTMPLPAIYRDSSMRFIEWVIQVNDNSVTSEEFPDPRVGIVKQIRDWAANPATLMELA